MVKLKAIHAASFCLALLAGAVNAQGFSAQMQFGGVFNWADAESLDAGFGFDTRQSLGGNLRLMWSGGTGPWNVEAHSVLSFGTGDIVAYNTTLAGVFPAPPPATMFELSSVVYLDAQNIVTHNIDRLSLGYAGDNVVLKVGRQAVSWGGGKVFHPLDIVSAFAPNAINTSYKSGVDMVYGQVLFNSGADIQGIYVPRPLVLGGAVDGASSTLGIYGTAFIGNLDASFILAQDRDDILAGIGLSGPLAGAIWNVEYASWSLANGDQTASFLMNISSTGSLFGANIFYFAEYFYNGFGVDTPTALDDLPSELTTRLATGQIFVTGRDTLALGAQISITPDISVVPNAIISLNDGSALLAVQAGWTIDDNTDLSINYSQAIGENGTEFGGRETSAGSGIFLRPANNLTIILSRYF